MVIATSFELNHPPTLIHQVHPALERDAGACGLYHRGGARAARGSWPLFVRVCAVWGDVCAAVWWGVQLQVPIDPLASYKRLGSWA